MATPYVTAAMLLNKPASISWNVAPTLTDNAADQIAQVQDACWKATSIVDAYCQQPLRASVSSEELTGPGQPWCTVGTGSGVTTLICTRRPIASVAAVQTSPATTWPPAWTLLPAGLYRPKRPVIMSGAIPPTSFSGGNSIDLAPGYVTWSWGRDGWRVLPSYISGWPHAGTTAPASAAATTLAVDDVTGWAGATGWVYDGQFTELATVTSVTAATALQLPGNAGTVPAGPGTLTLASPLGFAHDEGTVISALPAAAIHASVLAATVQALEVIDAIATQSLSGQLAGGTSVLAEESEKLLDPFRVVI